MMPVGYHDKALSRTCCSVPPPLPQFFDSLLAERYSIELFKHIA